MRLARVGAKYFNALHEYAKKFMKFNIFKLKDIISQFKH